MRRIAAVTTGARAWGPLAPAQRARGRQLAISSHPAGMTHRLVYTEQLPTLVLVALAVAPMIVARPGPEVAEDILAFQGSEGRIGVRRWRGRSPAYLVVLAHGYGEHSGRYDHVARALVAGGATVWAPDHIGAAVGGGAPRCARGALIGVSLEKRYLGEMRGVIEALAGDRCVR